MLPLCFKADDLWSVCNMLLSGNYHGLLCVDEQKKFLGIVSMTDVFVYMLGESGVTLAEGRRRTISLVDKDQPTTQDPNSSVSAAAVVSDSPVPVPSPQQPVAAERVANLKEKPNKKPIRVTGFSHKSSSRSQVTSANANDVQINLVDSASDRNSDNSNSDQEK